MKLVQILPRVAPLPDGVGDFAVELARVLRPAGIETRFVVTDPAWRGGEEVEGFPVQALASRDDLREILRDSAEEGTCVLLHYVGYGYAPDGAPTWLAEIMNAEHDRANRSVFVHEPWAVGPPWKRVFWTAGRQKACLRQILQGAGRVASSCGEFLKVLQTLDIPSPMVRLPLLVRDLGAGPLQKNFKNWLILGQPEPRQRALNWLGPLLAWAHQTGHLNTVVLAGRSGPGSERTEVEARRLLGPDAVKTCYDFSWEKIPGSLLDCGISVQHTQTTYLAKSTSFLTSLQWGQVGISRMEDDPDAPIQMGRHVLGYRSRQETLLHDVLSDPIHLQAIALAGQELYRDAFSPEAAGPAWVRWLEAGI
jgi:hypothetical protein